ncbi:MAG: Nif3-like dinuclear metal center hexameric protein [Gammaproteobacteria bacterium]|nr:Nif3-like dinuclear metal center hexameric protein [Gammaproteobacteria bacterium]
MNRVTSKELLTYTNDLLEIDRFQDYCPNGLQVEGKPQLRKIVSGVTASLALIDAALAQSADALLVHHGYFWRNESPVLVGIKRERLWRLLSQQVNLLAYHLPLDAHPLYGNNAQLALRLGLQVEGHFGKGVPAIGMYGRFNSALTAAEFSHRIEQQLQRLPLHIDSGPERISRVAWCSGAAQDYFAAAIELGADAFLTGEVSEWCVHTAREHKVHFYAAGHHATERYGVQALGSHLAQRFGIEHQFIEIPNPV